jgi:tRNA threonylcarbamoyladenosine biosynthesis protein TsaB
MTILTLRTDKPESELGLYENDKQLAYDVWEAHRRLAETLHLKINDLLASQGKSLSDLKGIVIYKGPGSFTGLRIGVSVANALAYSLNIPIVGETNTWIEQGIVRLKAGENDMSVVPEYGQPVHITTQKK